MRLDATSPERGAVATRTNRSRILGRLLKPTTLCLTCVAPRHGPMARGPPTEEDPRDPRRLSTWSDLVPRNQNTQTPSCAKSGTRVGRTDTQTGMLPGVPGSATCVQRFDDSRNSAIHITYRISLRSSSLREPRHPLLKVVNWFKKKGSIPDSPEGVSGTDRLSLFRFVSLKKYSCL